MSKTLVIILSETRAHELTFENFKKNVIDELNADLCVCIGVKPDYDYNNPYYNLAKYKFLYDEPYDFGDAFDYAYNILLKERPKYEKLENVNGLYGKLETPKQTTENIKFHESSVENIKNISSDINNLNLNSFFKDPVEVAAVASAFAVAVGDSVNDENANTDVDYDEIVVHTNEFPDERWRNQIYSIKHTENNLMNQDHVITYKKPLHWREFLKIKDQFMGGVKDPVDEHSGSAGILIFFRWFLLKNLIENDLINKYDRFVITRSDFLYQLPHPKLELMSEDNIWIPNAEHYEGYTDRHVVLTKNNIEQYLNIFNNFVFRSNEFFMKMRYNYDWNLERLIKFNLQQNNVLHLVKEFPYVMYSVRNHNGTSRWSYGYYSHEHGYYIKYCGEYEKSTYYRNEFNNSGLTIDEFYKLHI